MSNTTLGVLKVEWIAVVKDRCCVYLIVRFYRKPPKLSFRAVTILSTRTLKRSLRLF